MAYVAVAMLSDLTKPRLRADGKIVTSWDPRDAIGPIPPTDAELEHQREMLARYTKQANAAHDELLRLQRLRRDFEAGKTRWKRA